MFHNNVQAVRRLNNLIHLNNVGVPDYLQDVELAGYSFDVVDLGDFRFLKNFYCNFLLGEHVDSFLYFAEGALTQGFCDAVATNNSTIR
jgi:hypothetical protein